jgi:hypothetical protein
LLEGVVVVHQDLVDVLSRESRRAWTMRSWSL